MRTLRTGGAALVLQHAVHQVKQAPDVAWRQLFVGPLRAAAGIDEGLQVCGTQGFQAHRRLLANAPLGQHGPEVAVDLFR